jgi:peroxiredoxin
MKQLLALYIVSFLPALIFAGEFNEVLSLGDQAPAWRNLPGVDGEQHSLTDLKDKKLVVVVFTCNSCPIAADYEDRIIAFAKKHAADVGVVAINVNRVPADSLERMKERAKEKNFPYPYLFDESQQIARQYGAVFTPEFFVLNPDRHIAYMGGMDDNSNAAEVKTQFLEPAIEQLLKGEKPQVGESVARGCRIRYARERK